MQTVPRLPTPTISFLCPQAVRLLSLLSPTGENFVAFIDLPTTDVSLGNKSILRNLLTGVFVPPHLNPPLSLMLMTGYFTEIQAAPQQIRLHFRQLLRFLWQFRTASITRMFPIRFAAMAGPALPPYLL